MVNLRTIREIEDDIKTWSGGVRNKYILRKLDKELNEAKKQKSVEVKEVKEVKIEKLTEKDLFKLTKKEQIQMLNKLGIEEIPRFEKGRVEKILEKQ